MIQLKKNKVHVLQQKNTKNTCTDCVIIPYFMDLSYN